MTDVCKNCKYRELCEESEYILNCENQDECEHYDAYLEGEEVAWLMEGF